MSGTDTPPGASARVVFFGHAATPAMADIRARDRRWRVGGALRTFGLFLVIAPVVGLVPPHAPWAIGALGVGALLARRRWTERETLVGLEGACPRCGHTLTTRPARLRTPHPVTCDACHHQGYLELDAAGPAGGTPHGADPAPAAPATRGPHAAPEAEGD